MLINICMLHLVRGCDPATDNVHAASTHKYLKSYGHFSYIQSQEMAAILDFKACNWQITPKALPMDSLYQ